MHIIIIVSVVAAALLCQVSCFVRLLQSSLDRHAQTVADSSVVFHTLDIK